MEQHWFAPHVGYTMAKYGMSMCVLGLSGELRDEGVGVNALWPMTGIETAAVGNVIAGGDESAFETTRTADIMSDAAHVILEQDGTKFT